ncbi:uncharacterized protein LOC124932602 [Impatiens glandulifera]|uniref:uncharacterized protein LOC124932602 n=1 Tax=Impatiens glandulifera TaxID=253017 RepID=UPI001FB1808A|nr:uncharacterized protein LOC124932602 [Impatiens glandulifera]
MENLSTDLCLKIFCLLDHQNLATIQQVCRRWNVLGSVNEVWLNLFKKRWGDNRVSFYTPSQSSKTWKVVYEVQDRCDRVGLGLKIIREGSDYYLVHKGEIQLHLGSNHYKAPELGLPIENRHTEDDEPRSGILDKILFFVGDLETASTCAKRRRRDDA